MAFIAITSIGAVAVPMNAWWTTEELDYGFEDSGARVVVADVAAVAGSTFRCSSPESSLVKYVKSGINSVIII